MNDRTLDEFDHALLRLLKQDARRTGEALSSEIGLSPAACLRRVQRLRRIGAIEREIALISPEFEPKGTRIVVLLTIARKNPQRVDDLTRKFSRLPQIERIFSITGDSDIALIVACETMEAYADFCDAHLYDPPIEGFESLVVLREFPSGLG